MSLLLFALLLQSVTPPSMAHYRLPTDWDEGGIDVQIVWHTPVTYDDVRWQINGVCAPTDPETWQVFDDRPPSRYNPVGRVVVVKAPATANRFVEAKMPLSKRDVLANCKPGDMFFYEVGPTDAIQYTITGLTFTLRRVLKVTVIK